VEVSDCAALKELRGEVVGCQPDPLGDEEERKEEVSEGLFPRDDDQQDEGLAHALGNSEKLLKVVLDKEICAVTVRLPNEEAQDDMDEDTERVEHRVGVWEKEAVGSIVRLETTLRETHSVEETETQDAMLEEAKRVELTVADIVKEGELESELLTQALLEARDEGSDERLGT
jgi:hypothetical protein